ncbi:hypothetical protein [Streptomyces sp. NPDC056660]|uniref:hypothetical protein n=1 Tax=Streptomyces sp. NPDC056660 TaxID=3345897 RepID=UPI0036B199D9
MTGRQPGPRPLRGEVSNALEWLRLVRDRADRHGGDELNSSELHNLADAAATAKNLDFVGNIGKREAENLELRVRDITELADERRAVITYAEVEREAMSLISRLQAALDNWPTESPAGQSNRPSITLRIKDRQTDP